MFAVSFISRFMETPKCTHWKARKRILRYIAETTNFCIQYTSNSNFKLIGYTHSDFADSIDDKKSTSRYVFNFGSGSVAWALKKQPIVTLSSVEEEYVAAIVAACQNVWMRINISELEHEQTEPTPIFYDTKSAIALSRNHVFYKRSKHIDTRYHFIRELINNNEISVEFCKSEN